MLEIRDLIPIKPLDKRMTNESGYYGNKRYAIPFIKRYDVQYDNNDNDCNEKPICISELALNNRTMLNAWTTLLYHDGEYTFSIYENKIHVTSIYESTFGKEFIYMSMVILNSIHAHIKDFLKINRFSNIPFDNTLMTYRIPRTTKSLYFYIIPNSDVEMFLLSNMDNILNTYKTFTGKISNYEKREDYINLINGVMFYLRNLDWFSDFIKFEYRKNVQELNFKSLEIPEIHYDELNNSFYTENMDFYDDSKMSHYIDNFLKDNLNKKTNIISIDINKDILGDDFEIYIDKDNSKNLLSYLDLIDYIKLINDSKLKGKQRCKKIIENILNKSIHFKKCKFRIFTKKDSNGKKYYTCVIKYK